jgi:hypothetical protein
MANDYKEGDEIIFLKDLRAGTENFVDNRGQVIIPKGAICKVKDMNNSHIWVEYKEKVYKFRNIKNRMAPAGKAAMLLYGEKE